MAEEVLKVRKMRDANGFVGPLTTAPVSSRVARALP
jgi:hypothetical protein